MSDDLEELKAQAVSSLRAALMRGSGVEAALRRAMYQYPMFASFLFVLVVQHRFERDGDAQAVTALTARIQAKRAGDPLGFPARETELMIRAALGEEALVPQVLQLPMNGEEIAITVLAELFEQWRPEPDEVADLLDEVAAMVAEAERAGPQEAPELWTVARSALDAWYATGMHESPFAYGVPGQSDEVSWDDLDDQARLDRYDEAIGQDRENPALLIQRGAQLNWMGRNAEALADFERAVELDPLSVDALTGRGDTRRRMEAYDLALADYDRALHLDPAHYAAIDGRADVYLNLDRYEEAVAEYTRAIDMSPDDTRKFMNLWGRGITFTLMYELDSAFADFSQAVDVASDEQRKVTALEERGKIHRALGRNLEALADFDRALALDPSAVGTLAAKADTLRKVGRCSEALDDVNRAIALVELDFEESSFITTRGEIYEELGRHREALADYNRAIDLDPDNFWAIMCRGSLYRDMGRHEEALADQNHLLSFKRANEAEALAERGQTYQAMGQTADAQADFTRAIDLDPDLREELEPYLAPPSSSPAHAEPAATTAPTDRQQC